MRLSILVTSSILASVYARPFSSTNVTSIPNGLTHTDTLDVKADLQPHVNGGPIDAQGKVCVHADLPEGVATECHGDASSDDVVNANASTHSSPSVGPHPIVDDNTKINVGHINIANAAAKIVPLPKSDDALPSLPSGASTLPGAPMLPIVPVRDGKPDTSSLPVESQTLVNGTQVPDVKAPGLTDLPLNHDTTQPAVDETKPATDGTKNAVDGLKTPSISVSTDDKIEASADSNGRQSSSTAEINDPASLPNIRTAVSPNDLQKLQAELEKVKNINIQLHQAVEKMSEASKKCVCPADVTAILAATADDVKTHLNLDTVPVTAAAQKATGMVNGVSAKNIVDEAKTVAQGVQANTKATEEQAAANAKKEAEAITGHAASDAYNTKGDVKQAAADVKHTGMDAAADVKPVFA